MTSGCLLVGLGTSNLRTWHKFVGAETIFRTAHDLSLEVDCSGINCRFAIKRKRVLGRLEQV